MNVNTRELYMLRDEKQLEELQKAFVGKIKQVPEELEGEARKELAGKDYVKLDANSKSPLNAWAKSERKKNKRKMAKKSKKANR